MKTVYHTREVWFPVISVKIEPIIGTSTVKVWVRYTNSPEKDDHYEVNLNANIFRAFLAELPLSAADRRETARVIESLVFDYGLVDLVLFPTREGWGVNITLCPDLENQYLRGVGATPADAIRNSAPYPPPLRDV